MKKMKRALSLVLTMVMLLSMMAVPTGAVSNFADADLIENTEAVQITSGIGLFAGTTDGNFAPKATVTRAQMATIIVKMLRGSDFNADAFKGVGVNPFPDTADFEGGWAEGYINACSQMGVVAGYGDGTFKPGKAVTTAEALTMIINALGVDPGPGEWPMTYMAKAEEMKLYGDLADKPGTNNVLNRDQLAVLAWEGLKYSPEGRNGWRIEGYDMLFENYADALKAAGDNAGLVNAAMGEDSLASKVYELKSATGWITENQATGAKCTVLSDKSGAVGSFGVETGVDMLGHYVTVYYKEQYASDKQPGLVYTIVDESVVVTVNEAISSSKDYKAAFGTNYKLSSDLLNFDNCYVHEDDNQYAVGAQKLTSDNYAPGSKAVAGTYIIYEGEIVTYIEPVTAYASVISDIIDATGDESVWINNANGDAPISNSEDDDKIVEYSGMAIGDYVTYVKVRDVYVVSPVTKVTGIVTKTSDTKIGDVYYDTITLGGKEYIAFDGNSVGIKNLETDASNIQHGQNYDLYVTRSGRYIGFEVASGAASLEDTVYLLGSFTTNAADSYGNWYAYNKARGIDMEGKEVLILMGKQLLTGKGGTLVDGTAIGNMTAELPAGFYTVEDSNDKDEKAEGIQTLTAYPTEYSRDNPTYVTKTKVQNVTWTINGSPSQGLNDVDGISCWGKSGIVMILLNGAELDQNEPIAATVYTDTISPGLSPRNQYDLLVTRAASGVVNTIDVLVYNNSESIDGETYIYVTQDQLNSPSDTVEGRTYMAYNPSSGTETEYILQQGTDLEKDKPGFYAGKSDDGLYRFTKVTGSVNSEAQEGPMVLVNQQFKGMLSNGRLFTTDLTEDHNTGAGSAKVIDTRSEQDILDSKVPEITSTNQLNTLVENNPDTIVMVDVYLTKGSSHPKVHSLYVTDAVRRTVGVGTILYTSSGIPSDKDEAKMIVAHSAVKGTGEPVDVKFEFCNGGNGPGFYRFDIDAAGQLGLVYVSGGENKLADKIGNDGYMSVDGDGFYVTEQTYIVDNMDNGKELTLAELKDELAGFDLSIDYYCPANASGSGTKTAALVAINGKTEKIPPICDGTHNAEDWTAVTAGDTISGGNYYLDADITETITITGDVTLCLNGHSITTSGTPFTLGAGTVELCNCVETGGTITGGADLAVGSGVTLEVNDGVHFDGAVREVSATAAVIQVTVGGELIMNGGSVSGNKVTASDGTYNGAIYINGGTVTLKGGEISNNVITFKGTKTTNVSAAIVMNNAASKLYIDPGAVISGNTTETKYHSGGAVAGKLGTITMTGGAISGNTAPKGGGITLWNSMSMTMSGGAIYSNTTTTGNGGGVHLEEGNLSFAMTGGKIYLNQAAKDGGGVYVGPNATFDMWGGSISGNRSLENGGGVYNANGGTFNLSDGTIGGASVPANNAGRGENTGNMSGTSKIGGGVMSLGTFTMSGGAITCNKSNGGQGGGIALYSGTFTMTGGSIAGNSGGAGGSGQGMRVVDGRTATIIISGGKFGAEFGNADDAPSNLSEQSGWLADGYVVKEITGDPTLKYEVVEA